MIICMELKIAYDPLSWLVDKLGIKKFDYVLFRFSPLDYKRW